MIPVPKTKDAQIAFGCIDHLPEWEEIPKGFKNFASENKFIQLVSRWFFKGLSGGDMESLKPKQGVDKHQALLAIQAILVSFRPKHERKIAGAAYLLSEWFDMEDA